MAAMKLIKILRDLNEDEFNDFKWILKKEKVGEVDPIQESQICNADRRRVVDLMLQRYETSVAVNLTAAILKNMERSDLVTRLAAAQDAAPVQIPVQVPVQFPVQAPVQNPVQDPVQVLDETPAEKKLFSIRPDFVSSVSDPSLDRVLDQLLQRGVLSDQELEWVRTGTRTRTRVDKARETIDMVRNKGGEASAVLIAALCQVDPVLSRKLKLP